MTGSEHERGYRAHVAAVGHAPHRRRVVPWFGRWSRSWSGLRRWTFNLVRSRSLQRLFWGVAACFVVATLSALGLWWRLSSGPIELNLATPWLKAAIEENFGGNHSVVVGGTQLERDEKGRTSLRLRDIVVRDVDGAVVASAPKAEVGLSGKNLLMGRLRAQSLNLVGAEMSVRIETDGRLTVFAGADKRPIETAEPTKPAAIISNPSDPGAPANPAMRAEFESLAALMAKIDA